MDTLLTASPSPSFLPQGRVDRKAATVSLSILLALCWLTAAVRFYVRLDIQKRVSIDDGFLLFGLCCLTASIGVLFMFLDDVYTIESFFMGDVALAFQPNFEQQAFDFQKLTDVSAILSWIAICSVKLSFLFLFRKLIDRLGRILVYWWIVLVFVVITSGYGVAVYILVCPYFYSIQAIQCMNPSGIKRIIGFAISQFTLDIVGDLLILVIPVHLIWKIKIETKQKFWLASSLCLTVVMIAVTAVRISGIVAPTNGHLDNAWEIYWNLVSAEVGLIMTSATAFRTLYTSKAPPARKIQRTSDLNQSWIFVFIRNSKRTMTMRTVHLRNWMASSSSASTKAFKFSNNSDCSNYPEKFHHVDLRELPKAHIAGYHTPIKNSRHSRASISIDEMSYRYWGETELLQKKDREAENHRKDMV